MAKVPSVLQPYLLRFVRIQKHIAIEIETERISWHKLRSKKWESNVE